MSNSSLPPKILKGAFVVFYPQSTLPKTIAFQVNPDSIKRNILPPQSKTRFSEPVNARERISFVLSVDKNLGDEFFEQNEAGVSHGVLPFLSAIELLVCPTDVSNERSTFSESKGIFGKVNYVVNIFRIDRRNTLPYVSLLFGERLIPVKIQSIQIIEQAFDSTLQPIRASVEIVMDALTERESKHHSTIKEMYKNYQRLKVMLSN